MEKDGVHSAFLTGIEQPVQPRGGVGRARTREQPVEARLAAALRGGSTEEPAELAGEADDDANAVYRLQDQALATVDQLALALTAPGSDDEVQALKQALLDKASVDSLALQSLLGAFSTAPGSELGQHLGAVLAEIKDPEVEAMAQQMALSGTPEQMKAGLALLGDLGIASQETLDITRQIVNQPSGDPELLMGAIHAMPVMPLSAQEAASTIGSLARLADSHPNDGVRSNSLFKISDWARDSDDLRPVVQALSLHRPADDRISAAMALARSTVVDEGLRQTLIGRMTDNDELWEVRQYSATALERFKLSGPDYHLLESFRREQLDLQHNG